MATRNPESLDVEKFLLDTGMIVEYEGSKYMTVSDKDLLAFWNSTHQSDLLSWHQWLHITKDKEWKSKDDLYNSPISDEDLNDLLYANG